MNDHTMTKFFNQFIKRMRQDVKNIGIITDKDGTLLLNDDLKLALQNFREKKLGANIYLIANSGRTVQDMINCLEKENIPTSYFDYIIGDNGEMCVDVKENKELYKHTMDSKAVSEVIEKFLEVGGNLNEIRLTDGKNIYAYPSEEVEEYYKDSKDVVFKENISDLQGMDITKLTIASSHKTITEINKFIKENLGEYKTHIGKTSFPKKESNNFRLDFTRTTYKGRSI